MRLVGNRGGSAKRWRPTPGRCSRLTSTSSVESRLSIVSFGTKKDAKPRTAPMIQSMTQTTAPPLTHCHRCGAPLEPGVLFCRNCGLFVHIDELQRLSAEALRLEPINPYAAAEIWRQCLAFLPPDSPQYRTLYDRIG